MQVRAGGWGRGRKEEHHGSQAPEAADVAYEQATTSVSEGRSAWCQQRKIGINCADNHGSGGDCKGITGGSKCSDRAAASSLRW